MNDHDEDEFEDFDYDETPDYYTEDSADFFATMLIEEFPGITLQPMKVPRWRKGWSITLPPQSQGQYRLEERAKELRNKLFWEKGVLIAYRVASADE